MPQPRSLPATCLRWLHRLAPHLLAASLVLVAVLRALKVEAVFGANANCGGCMGRAAIGHDAWLLALGLGCIALGVWLRPAALRPLAMLLAISLLLVMLADLSIISLLNARLYLFDVFKFGAEWDATLRFVSALLRQQPWVFVGLFAAGVLLLAASLWPQPVRRPSAAALALSALLSVATGWTLAGAAPTHVNGDAFVNLWQLHADQGVSRPYSEAFVQALAERYQPPAVRCVPGQSRQPDVLVVMWESLSTYHSGLGREPDAQALSWVPQFDRLAREHTWFSAFHANGFTTDHGLIALITGQYPLPQPGRYASLEAFAGYEDPAGAAPARMRELGYWSGFFTSGDLNFLDKPAWLRALGFDHFEGAEHAFYEGMPRGPFAAAEDRALFDRFLQWQRDEAPEQPWLAFMLTVETHPPFVHRATGRLDEEATFRAADAAFGDFVDELERRGFFEHGVLIVLGDHRSMTPMWSEEHGRFGNSALARTPMLVAGASGLPRGEISAPFQQTDLLPSLTQMGAEQVCLRADQGSFLRADPQPPALVVHVRGDQRSRIDLYAAGTDGALVLAGDNSRLIGDLPPETEAFADFLHLQRVRLKVLESDVPAIIKLVTGQE
jgi:lipoteichoic acid synthase